MMNRRSLFLGAASLLVAPAIVRAGSLMPVKKPPLMLKSRSVLKYLPYEGDMYGLVDYANSIFFDDVPLAAFAPQPLLGETLGGARR